MNKPVAIGVTMLAATAAVAAPIVLALRIANQQATDAEFIHALVYARDVLGRSEATGDQANAAFKRLRESAGPDACAPSSIELMRQIDLASSYIQAVGFMADDTLLCSSQRVEPGGHRIGPFDVRTPGGGRIKHDYKMPSAGDETFILIEDEGYVAIVHKDLPLDVTEPLGVALATFARPSNLILTSRGQMSSAWIDGLEGRHETAFVRDGHVIAITASARYPIGAIAALPAAVLADRTREAAGLLVPVGVLAGLILALAVIRLARIQLALPAVLKSALARNEFSVVYQPVVDLATRRWIGAEVLIRWRRANGEVIRPDLFIPAAEDAGLIRRITKRVVDLVARDAGALFTTFPGFQLAINLSADDLHTPETIALFQRLASDIGARSGNLMVEVTERGITKHDVALPVIRGLRSNGVRVAIDDFGTGYSNLSKLQGLELDGLKIDKAFVDSLGTGAPTSHVVDHMIDMARSLHLNVTAEGVETEGQAARLMELGVHHAQGWLFGRPMPFTDLVAGLKAGVSSEAHVAPPRRP